MRTRRFLAATVVAALPLFVGALHAPTRPSTTDDAAPAHHVTEHRSGPRWLRAWGYDFGSAWLLSGAYGDSWTRLGVAL